MCRVLNRAPPVGSWPSAAGQSVNRQATHLVDARAKESARVAGLVVRGTMNNKWILVAAVLSTSAAFAEAGLPLMTFCGQQSCTCGAQTCTCGQWCNPNSGTCAAAQTGFCSSDSACVATCDNFICEGNVCVKGFRDGGAGGAGGSGGTGGGSAGTGGAGGTGGGSSGGGSAGGGTGGGSAGGGTQPAGGCGCTTTTPMFAAGAFFALAALRRFRRR